MPAKEKKVTGSSNASNGTLQYFVCWDTPNCKLRNPKPYAEKEAALSHAREIKRNGPLITRAYVKTVLAKTIAEETV